ncbi:glycosyl transferase [Lentzea sp. NBRC 105346]|uniref:glycosyltransferase n=1 Tax=Lentzea sp. NBRC 105346 TaxID=3032205 RepID=UPI0024A0C4E8|nr:glycosyltransferase [Lentzea sp. NBRC 105346]GLZ29639.1 glycosyl transferase [Lentzea sp. NBRC 105346]
MRILFTALGRHGHINPLLPLAVAALRAGHEVTFATTADHLPRLRSSGLSVAIAGVPSGSLAGSAADVFGSLLPQRVVADLEPVLASVKPELVICDVANPGGAFAARLAGIPVLAHGFGRVPQTSSITSLQSSYAASLGLAFDGASSVGDAFIDICPASVQDPGFKAATHRVPLRPVAWAEPGGLPPLRLPLVYLTLGSVSLLRSAIDGLSRLPLQVLVAAGHVDDVGAVPSNVRLESWVPQAELLQHADLVVHHGGSASTLGAFAAGVPQLVLPLDADHFANAEAVLVAGAGERLLSEEITADAVYSAAARLLADEAVEAAARCMAQEVSDMPSPDDLAARLPEYA